ncbi:MAG TPA: tetratricopeptide repeat protein [Chthoniobacterales bacterium]|jgi:tetratricopeptide (TPR) repeat protein|nr:tetratricopeptide repeat protein [Chthoniobacterales bacterium]
MELAPADSSTIANVAAQKSLLRQTAALFQRQWIRCAVLVVLGLVVHLPALPGELIWDDGFLAKDNPFIRSPVLAGEAFRHHLLLDSLSMHYRPVQNLSYMLDYFFWNTDTYGFHLSSVLWHIGSGLLLFALLQRLLPSLIASQAFAKAKVDPSDTSKLLSLIAFLLALIWVVHPVHSAAVDYISGRADSLAFFFAAGAWLLYLLAGNRSGLRARIFCYVLAGLSLLLALCSRESACMWVVVFLFHLFVFEKKFSALAKVSVLCGCLAVVAIYAGLRQLPEKRSGPSPTNGWPAPVRAVLMLRALGDYGRLMVFPSNLHMERTVVNPDATVSRLEWRRTIESEYLTVIGLLVLGGIIAGAVRKGPGRPLRLFGGAWFILAYLPISNVVDLNATVAEHWLYLPSVGFILFVAGTVLELPRRALRVAGAVACCAVVALSARSYVRSGDWLNSEIFYTRTLQAGGGSIRVILNLGLVYAAKGEHRRAEMLFRRALKLCPSYLIARNNLADSLYRQGKIEEADRTFREASAAAPEARKEYPRTWVAALNVAKLRIEANDTAGALEVLAKARRDYPGIWRLISLESELLRKTEGPDAALISVAEFARNNWWHIEAAIALGKLYAEKNDVAKAEAAFRLASRLDVHDVSGLNQTALLRMNQRRFEEAYAIQRRAIARQPDEPRQYLILSDILEKMGRGEEARAALAHVEHLQSLVRTTSSTSSDVMAN